MTITVDRKYKMSTYTISNLFIDGEWFCNVVEDKDRGLKQSMKPDEIKKIKKKDVTAIPAGTYNVTINVPSPKFSTKAFYKTHANGGRVPRILDVPGFDGILIHCGSNATHSSGCLIVGYNKIKGGVTDSQTVFKALYKKMLEAANKGEKITIKIG